MVCYSYVWFEDSGTIFGFLKVPRKGHFWLFLASFTEWRTCRHPKCYPMGLELLLWVADMVCYPHGCYEDSGTIFGFLAVPQKCHFWLFLASFTIWRTYRHSKSNPLELKSLLRVANIVCYSNAWFEDSETIFGFLKVPRKGHFWLFLAKFTIWRTWRHPKSNPLGLKFLLWVVDIVCYSHGWSEDSGTILGFLKVPRKGHFWLFLASFTVWCTYRHPKCNPLELKFQLRVTDMVCYSYAWFGDSRTIFGFLKVPRMGHFWLFLASFIVWCACRYPKRNPLGLKFFIAGCWHGVLPTWMLWRQWDNFWIFGGTSKGPLLAIFGQFHCMTRL